MNPLLILGLETSCDETSAALVTADGRLLGHAIHSQDVHADYGGVVPELAARAKAAWASAPWPTCRSTRPRSW